MVNLCLLNLSSDVPAFRLELPPTTASSSGLSLRRLGVGGLWLLAFLLLAGCDSESDPSSENGESALKNLASAEHDLLCEKLNETVGLNSGYEVPGEAGASRWGMPGSRGEDPTAPRVRRSWSSLDPRQPGR